MRKFIITNPKYAGEIEVVYDDTRLASIVFTAATISPDVIAAFKAALPSVLSKFLAMKWVGPETIIVEAAYELPFERFWQDYNKKINKARCVLLWGKLPKTMQVAAWSGIKKYDAYLKRESWRGKADPETYLRGRYWENEY